MSLATGVTFVAVVLSLTTPASGPAPMLPPSLSPSGAISGRISESGGSVPEGAALVVSRHDGRTPSSKPVTIAGDKSFRVSGLEPGVYVLELKVSLYALPQGENVLGLEVVSVEDGAVTDITLTVRQQTALTGALRFDGADAASPLPPHVTVNAFLALDGVPLSRATSIKAEQGAFTLRNAFGPRVIRCGYTLAPRTSWWQSRVLLDGVDITDIPTDFSKQRGKLVVVFTRVPSSIRGVVKDEHGNVVPKAWLLLTGQSPAAWQPWSTAADVVQADTLGRFVAVLPSGRYRLHAFESDKFTSRDVARNAMARVAFGGTDVALGEGERKEVIVAVQQR